MIVIAVWLLAWWAFHPKDAVSAVPEDQMSDAFVGPGPVFVALEPKDDIQSIIISKAHDLHIDPDLLLRIAKCESGFHPDAKNKVSTASGIFQFLDSTFFSQAQAAGLPTDNKNDPEIQAELAATMISKGGLSHWNASKSCWSRS